MSFKLKALVASLALVAALPASAAMSTSAGGNSALILTLYTSDYSATFDLGTSSSFFTSESANKTFDLAGTKNSVTKKNWADAWSQFSSAVVAKDGSLSNVQWGVFSGDNNPSGGNFTGRSYYTTSATGSMSSISTSQLDQSMQNFDAYITAQNALPSHLNSTSAYTNYLGQTYASGTFQDGAAFVGSGDLTGFGGISNAYGTDGKIGNALASSDATGLIGNSLYTFTLTGGANPTDMSTVAQRTVGDYYSQFSLSTVGMLTYTANAVAAVPEADTSAMMLAGLGLMGFIARRRKSI